MHILVVDDEPDLCEILTFNLESEGFSVSSAYSAESALRLIEDGNCYDLILLDVMMDNMSGFEMARRLRNGNIQTPIIFLTARNSEDDQLEGFATGGDDYISKPFTFPTVLARIRAVLKRANRLGGSTVSCGALSIDTNKRIAFLDGVRLPLTKKEYMILTLLMQHQGEHFKREQILNEVWDNDVYVGDRSVDVHIARLRKKLGAMGNAIENHYGFGYVFVANNKTVD